MARPREHDAATGRSLLDAAERLVGEGGPDAVSVRGTAELAGVATRAVYSVFGSKAGLLAALAVRGYTVLLENLLELGTTDDPAADLVEAGLHGFRPFAIERPQLFRVTFERVPAEVLADRGVVDASRSTYRELAARIERAQRAGVIVDRPVAQIAFGFHAVCQGLAGSELSREPPPVGANFWEPVRGVEAEVLWHGALDAFVAGLAPDRAPRSARA